MVIYLDHAATTPMRAQAREAWLAASELVGNPSSVHGAGQQARRMLEDARERLAAVLGAEPIEVIFTSGGTESINTALRGLWLARKPGQSVVVLPDGEHHATMETVAALGREGATIAPVSVDASGRILVDDFAAAVSPAEVGLATAMIANNEVGTLNDSAALSSIAAEHQVPLHLDAVAAFGHVPVSFAELRGAAPSGVGLVALSVSGHKIGAGVGTGALVVARSAALKPLLHGGAAQREIRAGTQDVAGAVAFAVAAELARDEQTAEGVRLQSLGSRLASGIRSAVPSAELMGDPDLRLPGNVHMLFPGAVGESMLFVLDAAGIAVSTGAACQAGVAEASHVVMAMGRSERDARSVLRFSLGRDSTESDVDAVIAVIADAFARSTAS